MYKASESINMHLISHEPVYLHHLNNEVIITEYKNSVAHGCDRPRVWADASVSRDLQAD